jgi:hypothetical protein
VSRGEGGRQARLADPADSAEEQGAPAAPGVLHLRRLGGTADEGHLVRQQGLAARCRGPGRAGSARPAVVAAQRRDERLGLGHRLQAELAREQLPAALVLRERGLALAERRVQADGGAVMLLLQGVVGEHAPHPLERMARPPRGFVSGGGAEQRPLAQGVELEPAVAQPAVELGRYGNLQAVAEAPTPAEERGIGVAVDLAAEVGQIDADRVGEDDPVAVAAKRLAEAAFAQAGELAPQVAPGGDLVELGARAARTGGRVTTPRPSTPRRARWQTPRRATRSLFHALRTAAPSSHAPTNQQSARTPYGPCHYSQTGLRTRDMPAHDACFLPDLRCPSPVPSLSRPPTPLPCAATRASSRPRSLLRRLYATVAKPNP